MEWNWDHAYAVLPQLLKGLVITIEATIVASLIAYILGLAIAILKMSKSKVTRVSLYWITEFVRRTPILVQLYVVFYVLPDFGIFLEAFTCGVIVLGVHFSTYTSEVFRAGIENVSKGQWEAAKSLNYNPYQAWKHVILPQAIPPMIPPLANYLITMFKETPLLAFITVVELFRAADQYSNSYYTYLEPMTLVGAFFLIVSIPSAMLAMKLEKKYKQVKVA
ncbi:ectoine/hydroxyectoine ABC transporter permease subunit EhuD [Candidatus Thioglobus sp. NP1]|jgi:polar amino acid transport system permease protein|uniref:ectoine/hydroxyectoine ABC transporter permease subunit EhuD n=1 Tax=Candidatus Thioglobus sp. NP1 TaxID=2508687 RepID=UPI000DED6BDC|nr:ectoine/hydroxyectoine ABC transporter permease subunit EhuD [Candidatus Thioglobus sp. NP1]AXE62134.1 ectoine/hydroxyectoine ABC transporter permease subunit EhuD [Candidatus Thioglobus sp. NP1]|tara:strand:+ start:214 stop:876 length:663 start_codon:yes stop_codon:yes gene_type:complete